MIIEGNGVLSQKFCDIQNMLKPDYSIEIGAHAAEFSKEISELYNINAVAFEANPYVYTNYRYENNTKILKYLNYAISDYNGVAKFKVHKDIYHGNNSIKTRVGETHFDEYEVQCYRLDTYLEKTKFDNACLWIDVEGANKEVLSGAVETLKRCSSVFIETEDQEFWEDQWLTEDVETFFSNHGFKKIDEEYPYVGQRNIIFIKEGAIDDYKTS